MTGRRLSTCRLRAGLYCCMAVLTFSTAWGENSMWSGPKPQGPLQPFILDMVGTPRKSDGTLDPVTKFHDTMERMSWHGHKSMRRIAATTKPGETAFTRWATVVFDEKTLLPYLTELRTSDGRFVRREFDGVHVKETRTTGDFRQPIPPGTKPETVTAKFDLSEPAFAWAEGVGLPVLLALPLNAGFKGSVPVISGSASAVKPCLMGPCFVERMTYHVVAKEEIAGISGQRVLCWKVSVPETQFFFWIACHRPRLEGVTWPRSAGAMTAGQADAIFSMGPIVKD